MTDYREPAPAPTDPPEKIFPHRDSRRGRCSMCGLNLEAIGVGWLSVTAVDGRDDVVRVTHTPTAGGAWACNGEWLMRPHHWRDPNAPVKPRFNPTLIFGGAFFADCLWHLSEWLLRGGS